MDASAPGSLPLRLAQAYGVTPPVRRPPAQAAPAAKPSAATQPAAIQPAQRTQAVAGTRIATPAVPPDTARKLSSLVAARVGGQIDFTAAGQPVAAGALPLYRHPADKNAAATAVSAGRSLDVTA